MAKPQLMIVIASTRPGRAGLPIGRWFRERAEAHGGFAVALADLGEINLPFMNEPNHPRVRQYIHQHTKDWSGMVDAADAFVFVTPEYNHGMVAPLKNALDYLVQEWQYKPVGFVSYGGMSGGLRAVQMTKQVVTALKMVPVTEAVVLPFVSQMLSEGVFRPTEAIEKSADAMLAELARIALPLRALKPQPTSF
jgi:NAD(P)H-dependent FMN reductase